MNVYDFDQTIYNGDSTLEFYFFCLKRNPSVLACLPKQFYGFIKYKLGVIDKTQFKEEFYCFLRKVRKIDETIKDFWNANQYKIKDWYKMQQQPDDLVISASPEFLLEEICKRIKIRNLIASKVDKITGLYDGANCYGIEKVKRYRKKYGKQSIRCFYSDSKSDEPMAMLALQSFLVKGNKIQKWRKNIYK